MHASSVTFLDRKKLSVDHPAPCIWRVWEVFTAFDSKFLSNATQPM